MADPGFAPEGGESLLHVSNRMTEVIRQFLERHSGEKVLAVSHGAAMALALARLLDDDPLAWGNYVFQNTSITELILHHRDNRLVAELIRLNCDRHLKNDEAE
jgi:probable phosphoglycerate mutase